MSVRLRGGTIAADAEVEATTKALRVTHRPLDAAGCFEITSESGTMAAGLAANAPIYSFLVPATSVLAIVRRIEISAWSLGTGFTAGLAKFRLRIARSWTVADTGGTTATLTTNNGKLRTSMASIAALSAIRYSSTATLTVGTRTLDAQALRVLPANVTTAVNTVFLPTTAIFEKMSFAYPLVLAQDEGFVIEATVPATGTWSFAITPTWEEVGAY